ncbi:hypothetical protein R1sor_011957 [Riccia sorocarpa]|uniref:Uncharacterized protein n=1 Tax=Riccia sorocarpa TaxID=122646 RepID=A0ABD3I3D1_9MARC
MFWPLAVAQEGLERQPTNGIKLKDMILADPSANTMGHGQDNNAFVPVNEHQDEKIGTRDDGNWGPCEIIKKAVEIFRSQSCTFTLIQFVIVFPCTIFWLLDQHLTRKFFHDYWPQPPCPGPCPTPSQAPPPPPSGDDPSPCENFFSCEWKTLLVFGGLFVLCLLTWINVVGSLFYAVGSAYAGKTVSFKDVWCALPKLWKGLVATGVWGFFFLLITSLIISLLGYLLYTLSSVSFLPVPIVSLITITVGWILFFYTTTVIQMANGISVFEDGTFGLRAFCKALELLKSKWCVALGIAVLFYIPEGALIVIVHAFSWACNGVWAQYFFLGVLANLLSVLFQIHVMASALFYLSSKQDKKEFISIAHFPYSQREAGYHPVGV